MPRGSVKQAAHAADAVPGGAGPGEPQRHPAAIRDDKILRTLAELDRRHERGEADLLIAPWRDRLAELRPRRPLTLLRLLCDPLGPLIVPANIWRHGSPGIPRTALAPLGRMVRKGLAETASGLDAVVAGHSSDETALIAALGARLWPRAGDILATVEMPEDWSAATGLGATDHAILTRGIAAVLSQATALLRLAARAWAGTEPETAELLGLLAAVAAAGPVAIAMMVVLLMESLPRSLQLVGLADKLAARQDSPAGRALTDNAVEFALDSLDDAPLRGPNLAQATRHVRRVVIMLNDLDGNAGHRPVRRTRIERIRRKLDAACRKRLAMELSAGLLAPAAALASAGEAEIAALVATAHTLRRFGAIARQICGADPYDAQMRHAAEALRPGAAEDAAVRGARVRLVESLLGPDAAVAALKAKAAKGPAA